MTLALILFFLNSTFANKCNFMKTIFSYFFIICLFLYFVAEINPHYHIDMGVYPYKLEIYRVNLIHKGNVESSIANFCLISNLKLINTIFE